MPNVVSISSYKGQPKPAQTTAQAAASKRKKAIAVLLRLRAQQHFAKIRFAEDLDWARLTDIVCEFIDWNRANCYISCNRRAA